MTAYQLHVEEWTGCRACSLCETRGQMCFARGSIPCDVLFVGEAPGPSENVLGRPFVGPAGHLLDQIVEDGLRSGSSVPLRVCFTNLLCCIPLGEDGDKFAAPPEASVKACALRLREFVKLCNPRLIVCVGGEARDWLDTKRRGFIDVGDAPQTFIVHPAAILRANVAQRGLMIQRAVVTLANAVEEIG